MHVFCFWIGRTFCGYLLAHPVYKVADICIFLSCPLLGCFIVIDLQLFVYGNLSLPSVLLISALHVWALTLGAYSQSPLGTYGQDQDPLL